MKRYNIITTQRIKYNPNIINEATLIYLNQKSNGLTNFKPSQWLENSCYKDKILPISFFNCIKRTESRKEKNIELFQRKGPNLAIPVDIQNSIFNAMQHNFDIRGKMPDQSQMKKIFNKLFDKEINTRTFNNYKKKTQIFL